MPRRKDNLIVGDRDVSPDTPAHTPGIREGNEPGSYEAEPGQYPDETASAERSTGIDPGSKNPIDPRMPNLPPP